MEPVMRRPGELQTGQAVAVVLGGLALFALGVACMWLLISQLPGPERGSAWGWFGVLTMLTTVIASIYQIAWWRGGALAPDTPKKVAEYQAQMKSLRALVVPIASVGAIIAVFAGPSLYVAAGSLGIGCLACAVLLGAFTQFTEAGRAIRAGRRRASQSE